MTTYYARFWRGCYQTQIQETVTFTFDAPDWSEPDLLGNLPSMVTIRSVHLAAYDALFDSELLQQVSA